MDTDCLNYCLTEKEHQDFQKNGILLVENAISPQMVENLTSVVDRLDSQIRDEKKLDSQDRLQQTDSVGMDGLFLDLLDWKKTFPKVWGILGLNIRLYYSAMTVTPPLSTDTKVGSRLNWHQDSSELNKDLESNPRPRISLKVAFFLTDTIELSQGNFYMIPGSHLQNELVLPSDGISEPEGATAIRAKSGTAMIFDRRLWHSGSPNTSSITRKVLFYGYSYKWLHPRDGMTVSHFIDKCDPIRQQLLGAEKGWDASALRVWLEEHGEKDGKVD